jgi:hypothetical protein
MCKSTCDVGVLVELLGSFDVGWTLRLKPPVPHIGAAAAGTTMTAPHRREHRCISEQEP